MAGGTYSALRTETYSVASEVGGILSTETAILQILQRNTVAEVDGSLAVSLPAITGVVVFNFM
jgi:hypothetical protein